MISSQNKLILKNESTPIIEDTCNCRNRSKCPLEGKCSAAGIVYQAKVTRADNHHEETYVGLADTTFKERYGNHKHSFKEKRKKAATTLSQYIWSLKEKKVAYTITWKIIARAKSYSTNTGKCSLAVLKRKVLYHLQTRHGFPEQDR